MLNPEWLKRESKSGGKPTALHALIFIVIGLITPVFALDPNKLVTQYVHDVWRKEQGLVQSNVLAIIQTRDGYLWTSSFEGVSRFDGVNFTNFNLENTPELLSNNIRFFYEDRAGTLWIAPVRGGVTQFKDGKFKAYTDKDGFPKAGIIDIREDKAGNLWFATSGGLSRFSNGTFTTLTTKDGLPSNTVLSFTEDASGALWLGTAAGLSQFKDGRFRNYTMADGLPDNAVSSLYLDRAGTLWLATPKGLGQFKAGKFASYKVRDGLPHEFVVSLLEDRTGTLWIGTRGGLSRLKDGKFTSVSAQKGASPQAINQLLEDKDGVIWIAADNGLSRFTEATGLTLVEEDGLVRHVITALLDDKEGSLWIGTRSGGLHRLRDGKFTTWTTREGLPANTIYPVLEDADGSMWIGMGGGGLAHLQDGKIKVFTAQDGLISNVIRTFSQNRDGTFWIGFADNGVNELRKGKLSIHSFAQTVEQTIGTFGYRAIYAIHDDRAGNRWLASFNGGIVKLRDGVATIYTTKDGLSNNRVMSIDETRDGAMWFGTDYGGINRFKDGKFTAYMAKDGLASDTAYGLYEDQDGVLWISGNGGLTRIKDGKCIALRAAQGLPRSVFQVFEDNHSNLWLGASEGIMRVSKAELNAVADGKMPRVNSILYGTADGMRSSECNTPARGLKARDGKLWFPTMKGVVVVDPDSITTNPTPPQVYVESLLANQQRVATDGDVVLAPGSDKLEFRYTALSLLAPDRVKFKYKLIGYDQDWVEADTRRTAYYTNLAPGSYQFQVIACNNDGVWNETGATLAMRLRPRFFQTWWFYGLCIGGLVLSGFGLNNLRTKKLVAREREKTELKLAQLRLEKAQMQAESLEAERQRQAKELEEARQLQLSMLPKKLPNLPHLDIAAYMKTASEVGGDYYDFHLGEDGTLTIAVGDATGHGLKAGTLVSSVKSLFVSLAYHSEIPHIFQRMNRVLKEMNLRGLFMAMTMVKVKGDHLSVSIAGMPSVLIYRALSGEVEEIAMRALPLGGMTKYEYKQQDLTLAANDVVVLMSDGLPERFNPQDEMLDYERIHQALPALVQQSAEQIIAALIRLGDEWSAGRSQDDDVTFVVLRVKGNL